MLRPFIVPVGLLATVAAAAATLAPQAEYAAPAPAPVAATPQPVYAAPAAPAPAYDPVRQAIAEWNRLRQSDGLAFEDYARFLTAHPGWPGEAAMRRTAERRLETQGADPTTGVS